MILSEDDTIIAKNELLDQITTGKKYVVQSLGETNRYIINDGAAQLFLGKDWVNFFDLADEETPEPQGEDKFAHHVHQITSDISDLLISKNKKYGNSALEPIRVFSKASAIEQILVRLDDKLSRLRTQHISEDEDVLNDLLGYLILLKIAYIKEH